MQVCDRRLHTFLQDFVQEAERESNFVKRPISAASASETFGKKTLQVPSACVVCGPFPWVGLNWISGANSACRTIDIRKPKVSPSTTKETSPYRFMKPQNTTQQMYQVEIKSAQLVATWKSLPAVYWIQPLIKSLPSLSSDKQSIFLRAPTSTSHLPTSPSWWST